MLIDTAPSASPIQRPFERDRMAMLPRHEAASAAFLTVHQVQFLSPEEAVLGLAVAFRVMCERTGTDPESLYAMAGRVLNAPEEGDRPTDNRLQSLKDFAGARIMGQEVTLG